MIRVVSADIGACWSMCDRNQRRYRRAVPWSAPNCLACSTARSARSPKSGGNLISSIIYHTPWHACLCDGEFGQVVATRTGHHAGGALSCEVRQVGYFLRLNKRPGSGVLDETSRPDESRVLENRSDVRPRMLPLLSLTTELLSLNPVVTEPMICCLPSRTKSLLSDIRILQPYSTEAAVLFENLLVLPTSTVEYW